MRKLLFLIMCMYGINVQAQKVDKVLPKSNTSKAVPIEERPIINALKRRIPAKLIPGSQSITNGGIDPIDVYWRLLGNTSTDASYNYMGTTDDMDVVFRRNTIFSGWLNPTNTSFGYNALSGAGPISGEKLPREFAFNTAIGVNALSSIASGNFNVGVGGNAMATNDGTGNVVIGSSAAPSLISNNNNTIIGYNTGQNVIGDANTILGANVDIGPPIHFGTTMHHNIILADGDGVRRINVDENGNTGINTTTPSEILDVAGNVKFSGALMPNGLGGTAGQVLTSAGTGLPPTWETLTGGGGTSYWNAAGTSVYNNNTGNVGINTSLPTEKLDVRGNIYTTGKILINQANTSAVTPYSLAVNGTAIFTKAVVKLNGSWPDYVFKSTYILPKLNELESYFLQNHHLPEIPSAAEVEKNGVDLGENQTLLVKKVEELTLYLIDLNKKVEALAKENEILKKRLNVVKK